MGVGVNDINLPTSNTVDGKRTKDNYYKTWYSMLRRCYDPKSHARQPAYIGCTVCDDWLYFSKFKAWMEQQDWEGKHLDKDLLVSSNKLYSPETCLFISQRVNSSLLLSDSSRGSLPLGVVERKDSGRFRSSCNNGRGVQVKIGTYKSPQEAHRKWQLYKINILDSLKDSQPDFLVKIGLQRIINKIQCEYDNNLETIDFN